MKRLTTFGCLALLAICVTPMTIVGCGAGNDSQMISPEMSADEIQAKADSKADEVVDPT
ncbi:hypothetical protein SAMN06265222_12038 [Neorhodopirellula lusitana]|uniref:Secreted protein n=1 Tax=Neorhodopirellula lusitana TaxID=445327 RepID=A0ABY1QRV7_9BACT|nr:hypothetical protein [Neorhodopirellula lusitana]SMP75888.1 hypothetical protein SAMN06265222_12038 [Neorhodopirellula lusitana]